MKLTVGKFRGYTKISNELGQFNMLALDQRNSLQKAIKEIKGNWNSGDLANIKKMILKTLSPHASAVLIDREYGFPENIKYIAPRTGIILSIEKSGYVTDESNSKDRRSVLYRDDAVKHAKKHGLDAVKLLIYWSDSASEDTKNYQKDLVESVGKQCMEEDILFILEILTYNRDEGEKNKAILNAVRIFKDDCFGVDLFKIEAFSPDSEVSKETVFKATGGKPWVILSGGMDLGKFKGIVRWNMSLSASGYLCGRVVWKGAVKYIEDPAKMEDHLKNTGKYNIDVLKLNSLEALPFYNAPYFGGVENIELV